MFEIDYALAMDELDGMLARLADPAPLLEHIGLYEVAEARERIQRSKDDPLGYAWAPWMPSTAAQRARKGNADQGLLWDTGALLDSITASVAGNTVTIGSAVDYAGYLQDGTDRMAARPFLGWSADALAFYEHLTSEYLAGALT